MYIVTLLPLLLLLLLFTFLTPHSTPPLKFFQQPASHATATADSKGKVQIKTEKPKASIKLSNNTRKSKEGINEIGGSDKLEKNEFVQDADSKLEKVELVEEARKCVTKKLEKTSSKFFRKKA